MSGLEILTVAESSAADRAAIAAGVDSFALMRAAGEAVARAVRRRWTAAPVAVLCGPGLNGGDGYIAAATLAAEGWPVRVLALADPAAEDARRARALWTGPVEPLTDADLSGAVLVIDALFGAGLSRPLTDGVAQVLRAVEASGAALVAVDLPSGLAGDTGKPLGYAPGAPPHRDLPPPQARPRARARPKPLRRGGGGRRSDLGRRRRTPACSRTGRRLWLAPFPWPATHAYKHSRGRLMRGQRRGLATGAARLAARAGLRIGAGLVTVLSPPDAAGGQRRRTWKR